METVGKIISLESEINLLKRKLDSMIDVKSMNTEKVLELSRELDELILVYMKQS